jgi:hypothetical protein
MKEIFNIAMGKRKNVQWTIFKSIFRFSINNLALKSYGKAEKSI